MRKICVVTGTRAEYGLMSRLMKMIQESPVTQLQIIATNMHLSLKYGCTYKEIEADGFTIDKKVPMIVEGPDNTNTILKSMSKALDGFADAFDELKPDIVIVLGDRYEILAVATAAMINRIPIVHISGGDVTEGAFDDAIRHSITKMSHLHFPTTEQYRKRVIQLGEHPETVFNAGNLGVENIKKLPLFSKNEIETSLDFKLDKDTILVTYHPVTLGNHTAEFDIREFISALEICHEIRIVFTMPNSDIGSSAIVEVINDFIIRNPDRAKAFKSLGVKRYLSVMKHVGAVVGNSSSGIVETPSFGIPTLNIGDRQKGRLQADSIVNCASDKQSVVEGLKKVLSFEMQEKAKHTANPYEHPDSALKIFNVISTYPLDKLNQKHFYDLL